MNWRDLWAWSFVLLGVIGCAPRSVPVTVPFAAQFGSQPFACAAAGTAFAAQDLKFYVHGVQLLAANGAVADVTLRDDGAWQNGGVALLDFEDGTGNCAGGTSGTHTALEGTVPEGTYVGLRFVVGVPFARNHANPAVAEPPLTLGHMHWGWQAGYKFLRFEGTSASGVAYRLHLGSTQCEGTIGHITQCGHPNRPRIELRGFAPGRTVTMDLNAFMQGVDLAAAATDGVYSCMSEPDDADCSAAFTAMGLDVQTGQPQPTQHVFSVS